MSKLPIFTGIDMGNSTIKVVQLTDILKHPKLINYGSCPTPPQSLVSESDESKKVLADTLKKLFRDSGISDRKIKSALPEISIFSRLVKVPQVEQAQMDDIIYWQAKNDLPVPIDEVNIAHTIIGESTASDGSKHWDVYRVAAPKMLINHYLEIFKLARPIATA